MTSKKQRPPFRSIGRRAPLPKAPAQKKQARRTKARGTEHHPNVLVLRLEDETPHENLGTAGIDWAIDDDNATPDHEKLGAKAMMDGSHEMFTSRGDSVRVCCECRRLRWGAEEYARFQATTSAAACAQCGRDSCPKCPPASPPPTSNEYEKLGAEIGRLVEQKQAAYGDAFGKSGEVLRVLYPNGIPPEKLDDAAAVIRVIDKLFRIVTDRDALGESPWRDIAGYGLLGAARAERKP